jgi:hypothetical protein
VRDYWGFGVCPCAIETPSGPLRMLGYPSLETFVDILLPDQIQRADAYVRATSFRHPADIADRQGMLVEPFDVESDTFLDDVCCDPQHVRAAGRRELPDFSGRQFSERHVPVGATVCAAGLYSAAQKALVPSGEGVQRLRLSTFSPELWASENRDQAYTYFRWGAFFGVVSIAAALASRWC